MVSDNSVIKKLVDSTIPDFYDSLGLLFINCDSIPRFPYGEKNLMVIQGVNKLSSEDYEIIHMAKKRWQNLIQTVPKQNSLSASEFAPLPGPQR